MRAFKIVGLNVGLVMFAFILGYLVPVKLPFVGQLPPVVGAFGLAVVLQFMALRMWFKAWKRGELK